MYSVIFNVGGGVGKCELSAGMRPEGWRRGTAQLQRARHPLEQPHIRGWREKT